MVKLPPSKLSPNQRHIIIYQRVAFEDEDEATIINCIWFLPNVPSESFLLVAISKIPKFFILPPILKVKLRLADLTPRSEYAVIHRSLSSRAT